MFKIFPLDKEIGFRDEKHLRYFPTIVTLTNLFQRTIYANKETGLNVIVVAPEDLIYTLMNIGKSLAYMLSPVPENVLAYIDMIEDHYMKDQDWIYSYHGYNSGFSNFFDNEEQEEFNQFIKDCKPIYAKDVVKLMKVESSTARGYLNDLVEKEILYLNPLIDVVTTNKTDFFREPGHFNFLVETALPELTRGDADGRPLLIWSAGCSSGEEPYTLAMVLSEYGLTHPGFRFRILATDISTNVLAKAEMGVYSSDVVGPVPPALKRKYLMTSRDPGSKRVRIVPELRRLIEFRRLNFMDADYRMAEKADAIFCRNVIIYFDRATQEQVLQKLSRRLVPRGYMFVGHSETLHDMDLPLTPVAPALYKRTNAA